MVIFLNRLAWIVALLVAIIPLYIDSEMIVISFLLLFIVKGLMLSKSSIENAVLEFSPKVIQNIQVDAYWVQSYLHTEVVPESINSTVPLIDPDPLIKMDTKLESSVENDDWLEANGINIQNDTPSQVIPNIPDEPSAFWIWIHNFFSDRPLAKAWWILLFLGALFFLYLIFDIVGPFGKVLIGIAFGFFLIGVGFFLDKKEIYTESRVLFGIGIAVNYLTILSGRHLLANSIGSDPLFSDTFATLALLMNTWLAIALSLVYRSRVLLGFAFIFAYATPFLVGSKESSIFLLSIYTTILTISIGIINNYYARLNETESMEYLQGIWIIGMTTLFSLASIEVKTLELLVVFIWLLVSIGVLSIFSYREKKSPLPLFAWAYIVLLVSSIFWTTFLLLPFGIIALLFLSLFFVFQNILNIYFLTIFWWISFLLWIFWFWSGGSENISILFFLGASIFCTLWLAILRSSSIFLSIVAICGFGALNLFGILTMDSTVIMNTESIMLMKWMSILIFIGASIFAFRLRDAFIFFLATIISGILLIYPNTFSNYFGITLFSFLTFWFLSLLVPYILTRNDSQIGQKSFLLASLPLSALIISYAIYQIWQDLFPWIWMGVAYIFQAIIYLIYAFIAGSRFLPHPSGDTIASPSEDGENILLILFALPLSLFTFSLAFLFKGIPGMMSLAWIIESVILYLVYTRMHIVHIFTFATAVFCIWIIKETTLLSNISKEDWQSFSILLVMVASIFSSLYILKDKKNTIRISYDILHIISILLIASGMSRIIPTTWSGWSLFGPALFLLIISHIYNIFGNKIHQVFASIVLVVLCFSFLAKFESLNKDVISLMIQFLALWFILAIGVIWLFSKTITGSINLGISLIWVLIISSLYVNYFFGTFAVSIYLTVIAGILIIRGVVYNNTRLRTIWLYIGIFILLKIFWSDIWQWDNGTVTRVFTLMITGWLMIYLSQLYAKHVSRSWSDEIAFSNIIGDMNWVAENNSNIMENSNENPFVGDLSLELKKISVSDYSAVRFILLSWESFNVKRVSVMRLTKHITDTLKQTTFSPWELNSAYSYVLQNLHSALPKNELDILLERLKKWIAEGGSIEFIAK